MSICRGAAVCGNQSRPGGKSCCSAIPEPKIGIKFITSCSLGLITNANRGFRLTCARTRLLQCGDQKTSCSDFVLINVKWGLKKDTHTWHAGWNPFSLSPFLLLFGLSAAIKPVKASNRGDFWMVVNSATSNWIMSEYEREAEKRVQMATFISFSFCAGISLSRSLRVGIFNLSYPNSSSQEFHYYVCVYA